MFFTHNTIQRSRHIILRSSRSGAAAAASTLLFERGRCIVPTCRSSSSSSSLEDSAAAAHRKVENLIKDDQASLSLKEERPRRTLFSVPGCDERKLKKAQTLNADSIVLDLEDGVPFDLKDNARNLVTNTLMDQTIKFGSASSRPELCVRINGLNNNQQDTAATKDLAIQDLESILQCERLQCIVIPKVESSNDIQFVSEMIDECTIPSVKNGTGRPRDIRIIAAIESAIGMLHLHDIVSESIATTGSGSNNNTKLDALVFASEDYCADLEMIRTPGAMELLYPRSKLVTVAKAYGLQAIDMVHINYKYIDELKIECQNGKELGFNGKQAIHPIQIQTINDIFSPTLKDIEFAKRIIKEYENVTATETGKGACVVDGIVVDAPVYKWAIKIMKRANKSWGMT